MRRLILLAPVLLLATRPTSAFDLEPIASVWYRGQPAGVPRGDDLAVIRARGFTGVTWPIANVSGVAALRMLADAAGLTVVIRSDSTPLTASSALAGHERVDVRVAGMSAAAIRAVVWRAIAHGARVISFDAGLPTGTGLVDGRGQAPAWTRPAEDIARQVRVNGGLLSQLRPGPAVAVALPRPPALDVQLLDAPKSWVVIATNASSDRTRAVAVLPASVPYALWLNLLDGSTLAMLSQPAGPRWNLDLAAWDVGIYVIDKTLK